MVLEVGLPLTKVCHSERRFGMLNGYCTRVCPRLNVDIKIAISLLHSFISDLMDTTRLSLVAVPSRGVKRRWEVLWVDVYSE